MNAPNRRRTNSGQNPQTNQGAQNPAAWQSQQPGYPPQYTNQQSGYPPQQPYQQPQYPPQQPYQPPQYPPQQPRQQPPYPPQQRRQQPPYPQAQAAPRRRRRSSCCLGQFGCLFLLLCAGLAAVLLGAYFLLPFRTNILLLGMDYADPGVTVARTDTIILSTFRPSEPYIGMLSIPRDLWVNIPGVGENRINTAHFFAEAAQPGTGPAAAEQTVEANFGVTIHYTMRIRFEGFRDVVDRLGGVDITLSEPMAGYEAGTHHLTGRKALAFVRDRADSDDFFRMQHGQVMLKALYKTMVRPKNWPRIPGAVAAVFAATDTNVPVFLWPRLGLALLRLGPDGVDSRIISREMVLPFTTNEGAQVLAPNWTLINPTIMEMFGQ